MKPKLPAFDGKTTEAVLVTNEGKVIPLQSGAADPKFKNYPAAKHAEGKAAIWIRENGSSGGVVYHNHPSGTCNFCDKQLETLLPPNAKLKVVPPDNAKAPNQFWKDCPTDYTGGAKEPKVN